MAPTTDNSKRQADKEGEMEKDRAYREFYEYMGERLAFFRRNGCLPQEEKEILEILKKKRAALVEKYGPDEFNPFDKKKGCP